MHKFTFSTFCVILYLKRRHIMGCVRLYPDIIVAAEISSSIFFWKSESVTIRPSISFTLLKNGKSRPACAGEAIFGYGLIAFASGATPGSKGYATLAMKPPEPSSSLRSSS